MPNRPNPQQEPESECCQETHHHHLEYLKNRMPTQQEMDDAAELFKVFGDPTRLKLLAALLAQEMCVCDLSDLLGISVGGVPSAAAAQNQPSGQKPSGGQVGLLFVGRRPCSDHFGTGNGARPPLRRADRNFFGKKVDNFKNLW